MTFRIRHNNFAVVILVALLTVTLLISGGCRDPYNKMDTYLNRAYRLWGFEGTVLVAVDGRVILEKGYGMANHDLNIPNSPDTRFYIGSITKQFTAAAILKLEEKGLLATDDPVTKYLPDFPADPWSRITMQQLLTHTSGLPNYTDNPALLLRRSEPISDTALVKYVKRLKPLFEPGTRFLYSNSGYIVLGAIIETVSGQSYEAFLHHEILKPAGMNNSGYARHEMGIPNRADGYTVIDNGDLTNAVKVDFSLLHTAGALYSTVEDMLKWDQALYGDKVLSKESIRKMLTPSLEAYACGWSIERRFDKFRYYHGGFLDGFNTTFDRWIEDRICIVVFSNDDEAPVHKIARGLAAILYNRSYTMPVEKKALDSIPGDPEEYTGTYRNDAGQHLSVSYDHATLYSNLLGQYRKKLRPEKPDTFFYAGDNTVTMIFHRSDRGNVAGLTVWDEDYFSKFERIDIDSIPLAVNPSEFAIDADTSRFREYVGKYWLEGPSQWLDSTLSMTISMKEGRLFMHASNADTLEIFMRREDQFYHRSADFMLLFTRDRSDIVDGCIIYMGGESVRGKKVK